MGVWFYPKMIADFGLVNFYFFLLGKTEVETRSHSLDPPRICYVDQAGLKLVVILPSARIIGLHHQFSDADGVQSTFYITVNKCHLQGQHKRILLQRHPLPPWWWGSNPKPSHKCQASALNYIRSPETSLNRELFDLMSGLTRRYYFKLHLAKTNIQIFANLWLFLLSTMSLYLRLPSCFILITLSSINCHISCFWFFLIGSDFISNFRTFDLSGQLPSPA